MILRLLTFRPSLVRESSASFIGSLPQLLWLLLTSDNTTVLCFVLTPVAGIEFPAYYQTSQGKSISFRSCSCCIYVLVICTVIGLLFLLQHHPYQPALYAVSVRQLERLPPASFRFRFATDTLAIS
jgi:hypothetical protein